MWHDRRMTVPDADLDDAWQQFIARGSARDIARYCRRMANRVDMTWDASKATSRYLYDGDPSGRESAAAEIDAAAGRYEEKFRNAEEAAIRRAARSAGAWAAEGVVVTGVVGGVVGGAIGYSMSWQGFDPMWVHAGPILLAVLGSTLSAARHSFYRAASQVGSAFEREVSRRRGLNLPVVYLTEVERRARPGTEPRLAAWFDGSDAWHQRGGPGAYAAWRALAAASTAVQLSDGRARWAEELIEAAGFARDSVRQACCWEWIEIRKTRAWLAGPSDHEDWLAGIKRFERIESETLSEILRVDQEE